jgi:hypothetical protein
MVCGTTRWAGGSDGVAIAPARDTTADVIMPSPRPSESLLRSDHRQNAPIAATTLAIITGTNSRRSSSVGIRLALHRFKDSSLPEEISKQLRICHPHLDPPADASKSATGDSMRR